MDTTNLKRFCQISDIMTIKPNIKCVVQHSGSSRHDKTAGGKTGGSYATEEGTIGKHEVGIHIISRLDYLCFIINFY